MYRFRGVSGRPVATKITADWTLAPDPLNLNWSPVRSELSLPFTPSVTQATDPPDPPRGVHPGARLRTCETRPESAVKF